MPLNETYSLIELAEFQTFIAGDGATYPDSTNDAQHEAIIDAVSRYFHTYTKRQLKQKAGVEEYHNGNGSTVLYLDSWPSEFDTLEGVFVDHNYAFGAETKITADSIVDNEVYYAGGFPVGRKNIKVVHTAGYSTIPEDLKHAALIMGKSLWDKQMKSLGGVGQVSIAGSSLQLHVEKLASPYVISILKEYSRVY